MKRGRNLLVAGLVSASTIAGCGHALTSPQALSTRATSIPSGPYIPGDKYYGTNQWIEYHAGNLPIIISAPHGGDLTPSSIPDRTESVCGGNFKTPKDLNTAKLVRSLKRRFHEYTGRYPHVIINRLRRTKLDANRSKTHGACGDAEAEMAWEDFHDFIELSKSQVFDSGWGRGWYIDVHGHSGSKTLLGYRLSSDDLRLSDAILNSDPRFRDKSTIRTFASSSQLAFASALLRGNEALGTLLGRSGYPSLPSMQDHAPEPGETYFQGGYNVLTHGCRSGGDICGVQVEVPYDGVRDSYENRKAFSDALVRATGVFLGHNFELSLESPKDELVGGSN